MDISREEVRSCSRSKIDFYFSSLEADMALLGLFHRLFFLVLPETLRLNNTFKICSVLLAAHCSR